MPVTPTRILPLYHFFERLRLNEFSLGIGEYQQLLTALHLRMNLDIDAYTELLHAWNNYDANNVSLDAFPKQQLLWLAKSLWLKPNQSVQVFEELFDECLPMDFPEKLKIEQPKPTTSSPGDTPTKEDSTDKPKESETPKSPIQESPELPSQNKSIIEEKKDMSIPVRVALHTEESETKLSLQQDRETETSKFLFTSNYYPIDRRKTQQNLKQISSYGYAQRSADIDIDATIEKTNRQGFFNEAVFKKLKVNSTSLLLLIDSQGSMMAFEQLTNNIKAEAEEALMPNKKVMSKTMKTFYFYNVPSERLYINNTHTAHEPLPKLMATLRNRSAGVIIISDGGAARGRYNPYRVDTTKAFLRKMYTHTSRVAWLNPFPPDRWAGNSAGIIAEHVAMFEATETGIKHAIDFLKGSSVKLVKNYE
jgi:uncharacterized protein